MDEPDINASPTLTTPQASQPVPDEKSQKHLVRWVLLFLLIALFAGAALYGGYHLSNNKAQKDKAALNSQIAVLESNTHELPADAVKVSECIPNMGGHYLPKGADPEYGPFMVVNKANKVIGIEYMASKDMYTPIPQTDPPVEMLMKDSPMYGWKYDHAEITHLPKGHEGLERDHVDVHMYMVTAEQQKNVCI
jgi:hypothetical protein